MACRVSVLPLCLRDAGSAHSGFPSWNTIANIDLSLKSRPSKIIGYHPQGENKLLVNLVPSPLLPGLRGGTACTQFLKVAPISGMHHQKYTLFFIFRVWRSENIPPIFIFSGFYTRVLLQKYSSFPEKIGMCMRPLKYLSGGRDLVFP
jgi:hypothetical protein